MFESIHAMIADPTALEQLSGAAIAQLQAQYPQLPADYFTFLAAVGHGDLGNLVVYEAPLNPAEVYTNARAAQVEGIVLFGDDMQGFCYGFDLNDGGRVVEIDPRGNVDRTVAPDFIGFLTGFLA